MKWVISHWVNWITWPSDRLTILWVRFFGQTLRSTVPFYFGFGTLVVSSPQRNRGSQWAAHDVEDAWTRMYGELCRLILFVSSLPPTVFVLRHDSDGTWSTHRFSTTEAQTSVTFRIETVLGPENATVANLTSSLAFTAMNLDWLHGLRSPVVWINRGLSIILVPREFKSFFSPCLLSFRPSLWSLQHKIQASCRDASWHHSLTLVPLGAFSAITVAMKCLGSGRTLEPRQKVFQSAITFTQYSKPCEPQKRWIFPIPVHLALRMAHTMNRVKPSDVDWARAWEMVAAGSDQESVWKWKRLQSSATVATFTEWLGISKCIRGDLVNRDPEI